jgi:hypothetical protein
VLINNHTIKTHGRNNNNSVNKNMSGLRTLKILRFLYKSTL